MMPDCVAGKMDPDPIHVAFYSDSFGEDAWYVVNPDRNQCYALKDIQAGIVDPTTDGLVYLARREDGLAGIYRYEWDQWDDDLPEDSSEFDFPENRNELNEQLALADCPHAEYHRIFVSPADGSIFYQCKDGKTYDLGGHQALADLDILLAIGADGRFLLSRVSEWPQPDWLGWFDHPPATSLAVLSGDGTFRPVVMPGPLRDLPVVAARSSDEGFLLAVQDEADTVSVLRTGSGATAEVVGQVAPVKEIRFTGAATGVLDVEGNFAYTSEGSLVFRSIIDPTMSSEFPGFLDYRAVAVITGP